MKNLMQLLASGVALMMFATPQESIAQNGGSTTTNRVHTPVTQFMVVAWETKGFLVTDNGGKSWRLVENEQVPQLSDPLLHLVKASRGELTTTASVVPNPASGPVAFQYSLLEPGTVEITLHDMRGGIAARSREEYRLAGSHMQPVDLSDLPSGVYYYRIVRDGGPVGSGTVTVTR